MKKFVVIILDGFGIGAMSDAVKVRPGDEKSNTLRSILENYPELKLKNLEKLGLMNAYGHESSNMHFSKEANYSRCALQHFGADTFCGHQEIMGSIPLKPEIQPFQNYVDAIENNLIKKGHKVEIIKSEELRYLLVDDYVTVADNIDADLGMAYNCTAPLDAISFEEELSIAKAVREVVHVNRVIPFGGTGNTIQDILAALEIHEGKFIGIHAVNSKSYLQGYQVLHLGYGVDNQVQAPTILTHANIAVTLLGKVADIVINNQGKSISCVDTGEVLDLTIQEIKNMETGFICANVQETDLAGHSQDTKWYKDLLVIVDEKLNEILPLLSEDDILIICADHGNDPKIGHNRHTRENVPILVYKKGIIGTHFSQRKTLSDIGATVCDFFEQKKCENGTSLLFEMTKKK